MLDPVAVERAEKSIGEFINSRSKAKDKANADADLWRISEDQRKDKRREHNRALWIDFYMNQSEAFAMRSAEFQRRARALEQRVSIKELEHG